MESFTDNKKKKRKKKEIKKFKLHLKFEVDFSLKINVSRILFGFYCLPSEGI